jgi:membrane-associated PAP2 superfamily phosphatase
MNGRARSFAIHLLPAVLVTMAIVALDYTSLDLKVTGWFYDTATSTFPWNSNRFLEVILHRGAKYFVALIAISALIGFIASFRAKRLKRFRPLCIFVTLALILAPTAVVAMKYFSPRHCPWDIDIFGGYAPYIKLLEAYPSSIKLGHCFPAGHASTGFCLLAFYFVGRKLGNVRLARAGLALGLIAGVGLGFVRVMQGAHFLSHVLSTAVVCWIVILILNDLILRNGRYFKGS